MLERSEHVTQVLKYLHFELAPLSRGYWSAMFSCGYPSFTRYCRTLPRWSPWSMIWWFLAVPPHAQKPFRLFAMPARSVVLSSMPSTIVVGLPNFRVSSLTRILCCSFSISPQAHKSFGSPQVEQISAMMLNPVMATAIYKIFKHAFRSPNPCRLGEAGKRKATPIWIPARF